MIDFAPVRSDAACPDWGIRGQSYSLTQMPGPIKSSLTQTLAIGNFLMITRQDLIDLKCIISGPVA